jgi:DNA (cytosine-5)-methyltransferase 1
MVKQKKLRFIDLFAGIGGFHLALHNLGAECVFASEWDQHARKTYRHNFKNKSPDLFNKDNFAGDITLINKNEIPSFDILTAGFPCQPFSQVGQKKGFDDTRGTLFFDIAEIIALKKPKAFFLENVRHLYKHDDGRTFLRIKRVLTKDLGYSFQEYIVKASDYGLPQHRPRLFMIGFKNPDLFIDEPEKQDLLFNMSHVMKGDADREIGYTLRVGGRSSGINDRRNWDSYMVNKKVRKLTPDEGKMMQGFPVSFEFPVSEAHAMKQLGNSVAVNAVQAFAREIIKQLH